MAAALAIAIGISFAQADDPDSSSAALFKQKQAEFVEAGIAADVPLNDDGSTDTDAIAADSVPGSECHEFMDFLASARVRGFLTWYGGDIPDESTMFYKGCPDMDMIKSQFEAAVERTGWHGQ